MVNLICRTHNHTLAKSLNGFPYHGRLIEEEKIVLGDMTKFIIKPKNIIFTLKEHNDNNCTTINQAYNARYAYRSFVKVNSIGMQQLMMLFWTW